MTDVVPAEVRSRMMAGIRGRDTAPELAIRRLLTAAGFRYRLHRKDLPGSPDIVMPGRRIAIFVHGCFWHGHKGCRYFKQPATNQSFWRKKLDDNVERDRKANDLLIATGWRVLIVWECATKLIDGAELRNYLGQWILGHEKLSEIPGRNDHETSSETINP